MNEVVKVNPAQTCQLSLSEKLLAIVHHANEILFRLQERFSSGSKKCCGYSRMHNRHNRS